MTTLRYVDVITQGDDRDTLTLPDGEALAAVIGVRPIGAELQWQIITTQEGGPPPSS